MSDAELALLLSLNRQRYCAAGEDATAGGWEGAKERGSGIPPDDEELL